MSRPPLFNRLALIGVGLIGSSIARAARAQGVVRSIVATARSGRILGAAVLASEGAELVHLFVDVMNARGRAADIRDAIHIHPTLAEAVQSAVAGLE